MKIGKRKEGARAWLLLLFRLPGERASERVEVWRRLKLYGAVALHGSGYLLPDSQTNLERFQWLAAAIRKYEGEASIARVREFDLPPVEALKQLFLEARSRDYESLLEQLHKLGAAPRARGAAGRASRARQRLEQIKSVDFFDHPLRLRAEELLETMAAAGSGEPARDGAAPVDPVLYRNRRWVTRPAPGIDRVASAWLIRRFIDPRARFVFADDPRDAPRAVPFDMFHEGGFGHRGDDCTFETLRSVFAIGDVGVESLAQIVHDADLGDGRYGRAEGVTIERVLDGWREEGLPDQRILTRGMELVEGLYRSLG